MKPVFLLTIAVTTFISCASSQMAKSSEVLAAKTAVLHSAERSAGRQSAAFQDAAPQFASADPGDVDELALFGGDVTADLPACPIIAAPASELATSSKYDQNDASRSTIDPQAAEDRNVLVQPIRNAIRALTDIAYSPSNGSDARLAREECVLRNLDDWARAGSLTKMDTTDAYLSRDRWAAEIALALVAVSRDHPISSERRAAYRIWLGRIARDTVDAYTLRLGPNSRINNHRYWAGLSVAAIGFFSGDKALKDWGKQSFEIGACQVDANGYLPAELARGKKALEYHLYAWRPLAAIVRLASDAGEPIQSQCMQGFMRLSVQTQRSLANIGEFEKFAGQRQTVKLQESSYSPPLRLKTLSFEG